MNGVIFVDKKENWTSRDVVNKISKIYQTKKVGHTGTLDPMATGVLIICIGAYTKLVEELTNKEKEYIATMQLGIKTDTKDITGTIIKEEQVSFNEEEINNIFTNFPHEYIQTVPEYSAVKVNGKKLYEYQREGIKIELPKRTVQIKELELLKIENNYITFRTIVSKGTYIRSLIEDIATSLGTVATMTSLRRTKQGIISINDCYNLEEITSDTKLKTIDDLFTYPKVEVDENIRKKIENGNKLSLNCSYEKVILTYNNNCIAIYQKDNLEYKMVFKVI